MNNNVFAEDRNTPYSYSTEVTRPSIHRSGSYALAKQLITENPDCDIVVDSQDGMSIIPVDAETTLLIPTQGALFETSVSIRETKGTFKFGPYDFNADTSPRTFAARYADLTSDDNILSETESLDDNPEQKEYEICKIDIQEVLELSGESIQFEELMSALTELLENNPAIIDNNGKTRPTTPDDILMILETLVRNKVRIEVALQEMNNFSCEEFNQLVLEKEDKFSLYSEIIGCETDEDYEDDA